jgi:alpha-tubulin suppressor-like RCC1 family protein
LTYATKREAAGVFSEMNLQPSFSSTCHYVMLIGEDSVPYYWGEMESESSRSSIPQKLSLPNVEDMRGHIVCVSAGQKHTLLLTRTHQLFTIGDGSCGQLGLGDTRRRREWTEVPFRDLAVSVCCGTYFSTATTHDGSVWVWGKDPRTAEHKTVPTKVDSLPPVVQVACGWDFVLALGRDNCIYVWGSNDYTELGHLSAGRVKIPILGPSIPEPFEVICGSAHSLVITRNGALYGWGFNGDGCLGLQNGSKFDPTLIIPAGVKIVAAGADHTLVLLDDGRVIAWGRNREGQVGFVEDGAIYTHHEITVLKDVNVTGLGCGLNHSWAIDGEGHLYLWGDRKSGQMANDFSQEKQEIYVLPDRKFKIPPKTSRGRLFWDSIFVWLFLGQKDQCSVFALLPTEVLFNLVVLYFK